MHAQIDRGKKRPNWVPLDHVIYPREGLGKLFSNPPHREDQWIWPLSLAVKFGEFSWGEIHDCRLTGEQHQASVVYEPTGAASHPWERLKSISGLQFRRS